MAYEYSELVSDIKNWTELSVKEGWIDAEMLASLTAVPADSATDLFSSDSSDRPLVVAFMGGTGVGKSSLLNKLAGQAIAKSGVERPTSREVTFYHHQSVSLVQLENKFPLQHIKVAQHTQAANEKVIWIDMPDFDSTEQKNKAIVMQWLPYIDILIYVVSPERYRDNKAWQLLLSEGANHAWLFVMNQWDRGDSSQYEDFKQQLAKAGFDNPLIYKTACVDFMDDELSQLQETIQSIANDKTIEQLEQRGIQQRKTNLKDNCQQCIKLLGDKAIFPALLKYQSQTWMQTVTVFKQGFEWPIKQASIAYAETGLIQDRASITLWDDWAQNRFNDYLDDLIVTANQNGLPSIPLRTQLMPLRNKAEQIIQTQAELACRKALVNPGNAIQRSLLTIANICELILPLLAMSIVGFQVFEGYYDSAFTDEDFLGVNFVVHSLLLILISWLFPFFIKEKMQPSLAKAALKGLYNGVNTALSIIKSETVQAINELKQQHQEQLESITNLMLCCDEQTENKISEDRGTLGKMLVENE